MGRSVNDLDLPKALSRTDVQVLVPSAAPRADPALGGPSF